MSLGIWWLWVAGAFLCGSIPFAVMLGKLNGVDIREHGSGNPGASNLGRAVGKPWGILCFLLDVGKGVVPTVGFLWPMAAATLTARYEADPRGLAGPGDYSAVLIYLQWVLVAVAAVLGHVFSPWLKFRGGKGVATGLGATLGLFPIVTIPGVLAFFIWLGMCKVTGYVGLASVIAAACLPVMTLVSGLVLGLTLGETLIFVALTATLAGLVIWRHRGNLARIREGTEAKAAWTGRS